MTITRREVEELLAMLDAPMTLPPDNSAEDDVVRVPVIYKGRVIGHKPERAPDYRIDAERSHRRRIRELRDALESGEDPYRIAWLALSVGAGTALPALMQREIKRREDRKRGKAKAGKSKVKAEPLAKFLKAFAEVKGPTDHARTVRAMNKSAWPYSKATALRIVKSRRK